MLAGHIVALHTIGCHGQQGRLVDESRHVCDKGRHEGPLPHQSSPCKWAHMIKRTDKGEPCLGSPRHSATLQGAPADKGMLQPPGPLRER